MSSLLYTKLADELWMLAVSYLPIRTVIPHLPLAGKYFNDVIVWGATSVALMWREMALSDLNNRVFGRHSPKCHVLVWACARSAPLHHVSTLVSGGVDVNQEDIFDRSALHHASDRGRGDLMQILLRANANPNIVSNRSHRYGSNVYPQTSNAVAIGRWAGNTSTIGNWALGSSTISHWANDASVMSRYRF